MNYILFLKAFLAKYKGIKDNQLLFQYLREELQYLILYVLYTGTRYPVYFMGGTKLRLSYGINRFSEDIDLALDKPDLDFPAKQFLENIASAFSEKVTGFSLKSNLNTNRNVIKLMFSFSKVLFDAGLSPLPGQTVKIKLELDKNPPDFASYERKTYRSMAGDYMIGTYDLATGFAGKIAAVLFREYQKGRDYYDLQWYLQYKPAIGINLKYMNANSVQQGKNTFENEKEVLAAVIEKVKKLDLLLLRQDLERFVVMDARSFGEWVENYIPQTLNLLQTH
ncbi:nucleotidyl transferase AbiEii/AbiGii toxin family protein [Candidatus Peregrinibacteria bacterium]|nr:nucleotidyl transferase AbiEii/AbiGii toxin family protein [Candidatus Peregrinibacteria bacterium]